MPTRDQSHVKPHANILGLPLLDIVYVCIMVNIMHMPTRDQSHEKYARLVQMYSGNSLAQFLFTRCVEPFTCKVSFDPHLSVSCLENKHTVVSE